MSRNRLTVVIAQAPGKHPAKRALEESLAAALIMEPGLDISIVPHLYDLDAEHTGRLYLGAVNGDLCVISWLFPRAAFWLLDRDGIKGHFGETKLKPPPDDDEDESPAPPKGIGAVGVPERHIYTLDFRDANAHGPFVAEVRRIAAECEQRRQANAKPVFVELGLPQARAEFSAEQLLAPPNRRWYPVVDYSRCTNCLECLDFCLFGVYGVDSLERLVVENQDQCKKGCPACSRVCPEQAIMFPDYKTPVIAGADVGVITGLKIDLSKLFGGDVQDAVAQAVSERDRELVADGREAVGAAVGFGKRQTGKPAGPRDDLDQLMDDLDSLGL